MRCRRAARSPRAARTSSTDATPRYRRPSTWAMVGAPAASWSSRARSRAATWRWPVAEGAPVAVVREAGVSFAGRQSLLDVIRLRPAAPIRAVDGVSFSVSPGEVLAIVGESGSGKTTTANLLLGLLQPSDGQVLLEGRDLGTLSRRELGRMRRRVQMIFQDPYESLNPRMRVYDIVAEPLRVHGVAASAEEARARVREALAEAGMTPVD